LQAVRIRPWLFLGGRLDLGDVADILGHERSVGDERDAVVPSVGPDAARERAGASRRGSRRSGHEVGLTVIIVAIHRYDRTTNGLHDV
jgi:hypothetical protein